MLLVVDIDGCLADWKARDKAVGGSPGRSDIKAYKAYVENLMDDSRLICDQPVPGMQTLLRALSAREGVEIVYLTGRSEKHRLTTARWLLLHRFPEADIVMRGPTDWRKAPTFKAEKMNLFKNKYESIMAIEDEPEVVKTFTSLGLTVLQVHYETGVNHG